MVKRAALAFAVVLFAGTATGSTFWGVSTSGPGGPPPYVAPVAPAPEPRGPLPTDDALLPRPPVVLTAVAFWTGVYTDVGTNGGFIHDSRHLDVVYEKVELPEGASRRTRNRAVANAKKRYSAIIATLASGRRSGLNAEQTRVLALWEGKEADLDGATGRLRFQLGQANRFREGLQRSGIWMPYIQARFDEAGLPGQLAALPHVESSFNPGARSHVGATGMWQFTRSTGRRYMRIDHVVDERLDPFLATDAAIQLLSHDYQMTGSWPLAITSYNHGAAGMRRASKTLGTDDIGVIIEQYRGRTFGFASRNFYPALLAAIDINADPDRYFGEVEFQQAAAHDVLETDAYYPVTSLARALGVDQTTLRQLNPALKESVWIGDKHIPKGFPVRAPAGAAGDVQPAVVLAKADHFDKQRPDETHRVQRGEALSVIASQYGITVRQLMAANDIRNPNRIRAGSMLRLPVAGAGGTRTAVLTQEPRARAVAVKAPSPKPVPVPVAATPSTPSLATTEGDAALALPAMDLTADPSDYAVASDGTIRIQPVETLGHYADWLEVRATRLRQLNGMRYGKPVVVGKRLRLDFTQVDRDTFEARRRDFHRELQEAFFARRHITGTTQHVVRSGDSLWELSEVRYNVPVWLLRQYNPDVDLSRIQPGNTLVIPRVGDNRPAALPATEPANSAGQAM